MGSFLQNPLSGGSKQLWDYNFSAFNYSNAAVVSVPASGGTASLFTITGKGIVNRCALQITSTAVSLSILLIIDGVSYELAAVISTNAYYITTPGSNQMGGTTGTISGSVILETPIKFKNSFTVALKNYNTSSPIGLSPNQITSQLIYYS